eukprot:NODE_13647_length_1154_cov_6.230769.p7 GENE.NODE_13647_length_1154_cov_6.230769~~NODE_13647_length_1154_cov_6.230769.p7  ORF type:complete len:66 (+),score=53.56 NODE_13647_length_1154_cov_6.230769:836-1033(+)
MRTPSPYSPWWPWIKGLGCSSPATTLTDHQTPSTVQKKKKKKKKKKPYEKKKKKKKKKKTTKKKK